MAHKLTAIAFRRPFAYDPSRAQTVLLVPFDDNSGPLKDIGPSAKTLTSGGGVATVRNRTRWSTASIYFGDVGSLNDRVTVPDSSDWQFGTGPFQIRMSILLGSTATDLEILALRKGADPNSFWFIRKTSANKIRVYAKTSTVVGTDVSTTNAFPVSGNNWHDLEIRRGADGLIAIYIDGLNAALTTTTNTANFGWPAPATTPLIIGNGDDTYANGMNGNIQWLRIKKGVAPPPEYRAFPPYGRYPIPAY